MRWNPSQTTVRWRIKPFVFLLGLAPFLWYGVALFNQSLGANPIEAVIRASGDWALRFLLVTLAVTPMRRWFGWNWLIRLRRMLGLYAFFYGLIHLTLYLGLDLGFDGIALLEDIVERPFITVGMAAMIILLALALTSPNAMVRRLGKHWSRLHRSVYGAAVLAVLHFWWMKASKVDVTEPLIYALVLAALLVARVRRSAGCAAPRSPAGAVKS